MRRAAPIALAAALAAALPAGGARAQTLTEALAAAYSTNPELLAARARLRAVDETVPQALSGWRPTVTIGTTAAYVDASERVRVGLPGGQGGASIYRHLQYPSAVSGATLRQSLIDGGRTRAAVRQAENGVYAERARLLDAEQRVLLSVVQAYADVLRAGGVLDAQAGQEAVLAQFVEMMTARMRIGANSMTDVAQAQVRLAGASAARRQAEVDLAAARDRFRQVAGLEPQRLTPPQPLAVPVQTAAEAARLAALNQPAVAAALFQQRAARDNVDAATSALLPQVSAQVAGFRQDNQVGRGVRLTGGQATLSVVVPLYQGGGEYATVLQARAGVQEAARDLDAQQRDARSQAARAFDGLEGSRAQLGIRSRQVRVAALALEGVRRDRDAGLRTVIELLNADQELLNAQVQLVSTRADLVVRSYELAASIGRLTALDLALPVVRYDAAANLREARSRFMGIPGTGGDAASTRR